MHFPTELDWACSNLPTCYFDESTGLLHTLNTPAEPDWLRLCRRDHIDPDEVRLVFSRFDAYRQYGAANGGTRITLEQWFRFYHLEKTSDGQQTGPAPSGCSVDSDAVNNACIHQPGPFLEVLKAYSAEKGGA